MEFPVPIHVLSGINADTGITRGVFNDDALKEHKSG